MLVKKQLSTHASGKSPDFSLAPQQLFGVVGIPSDGEALERHTAGTAYYLFRLGVANSAGWKL